MSEIHCHTCGGFISDPAMISYRTPGGTVMPAVPYSGLCACTPAIVYGPPPGFLSKPDMASIDVRAIAARN
jgi:hypothetical protein